MATIYVRTTGNDTTGDGSTGNPYATPGKAASVHSGNDHIVVGPGTYTITSASTNVAGGCVSLTAGAASACTVLRAEDPNDPPLLQADGTITTFTIVTLASNCRAEYIRTDGNSRSSSRGFNSVAGSQVYACRAANCTNTGFNGAAASRFTLCYATGCSSVQAFSGGIYFGCVAESNTNVGFAPGAAIFCIARGNSGASSDGFVNGGLTSSFYGCVSHGNGRDGFRLTNTSGAATILVNCAATGNTSGTGFNANAGNDMVLMSNCAGHNNSTNVSTNITAGNNRGFVTLSADPWANAGSGDFAPNTTSGGGAALRAAGLLGAFPVIATTGYHDIGAAQHQDPGGGGGGLLRHPGMLGGCNG